jgi:hypothetical protein
MRCAKWNYRNHLVGLAFAVLLVSIRSHEIRSLALVLHLQLDEPCAIFSFRIHQSRLIGKLVVDFDDCSRDRGVNIRCRLDGLDTAKGVTLLEFITNFRKVNKNNITEGSLCKVSDTADTNTSLNLDVFVSYRNE